MKNKPILSKNNCGGFTITELLVTLIIAGILSSVSFNSFQRSWRIEQLKLSARTTAAFLEDSRVTSMQRLQTCKLLVNDSNTGFEPAETGNTCTELATLNIKTDIDYGSNIFLCSRTSLDESSDPFACNSDHNNPDGTTITFTPRGTAVGSALIKMGISNHEQLRCIGVTSPLGLIRQGIDNGNGCNFNTAF